MTRPYFLKTLAMMQKLSDIIWFNADRISARVPPNRPWPNVRIDIVCEHGVNFEPMNVSAKELNSVARNVDDDFLIFEQTDDGITLNGRPITSDNFPTRPSPIAFAHIDRSYPAIGWDRLSKVAQRVNISAGPGALDLTQVIHDHPAGAVELAAYNAYTLARSSWGTVGDIGTPAVNSGIIPSLTSSILAMPRVGMESVHIGWSSDAVTFQVTDTQTQTIIFSELIDQKFCDIKNGIPKKSELTNEVIVLREDLSAFCEIVRASLSQRQRGVNIEITDTHMIGNCKGAEVVIPCTRKSLAAEPCRKIIIDPTYIEKFLQVTDDDAIRMYLANDTSPVLFTSPFTYAAMPMRSLR